MMAIAAWFYGIGRGGENFPIIQWTEFKAVENLFLQCKITLLNKYICYLSYQMLKILIFLFQKN